MDSTWKLFVGVFSVLLVGSLTTFASGAPTISWSQKQIAESVSPGEQKNISVYFTSAEDVGAVEVFAVPELRAFLHVVPTTFTNVRKGQRLSLNVIVEAGANSSFGTVEGTLHIRGQGDPQRTFATPLPVKVTFTIPEDTVLEDTASLVGKTGGKLILPGLAELQIPEGAFPLECPVTLQAITSSFMDFLSSQDPTSPLLLSQSTLPRLRMKSGCPIELPLDLTVFIPNRGTLLSPDQDLLFVGLIRQFGDNGEQIDSLLGIGGRPCLDKTAACLTIPPNLFNLLISPVDPSDPVLQISVSAIPSKSVSKYFLWKVSNAQPTGLFTILPGSGLTVSATISLETNIFPSRPTDAFSIGSEFGETRSGHPHAGIDARVGDGDNVRAVLDDDVTFAEYQHGNPKNLNDCQRIREFGNLIILDHDNGSLVSRYAHLMSFFVNKGDKVEQDQLIGAVDHTGGVCSSSGGTGAHLHFEMDFLHQKIDPLPLFERQMVQYLPYELKLIVDGSKPVGVLATVDPLFYNFSQTISTDELPTSGTLSLYLSSAKLGYDRLLQEWSFIKVTPDGFYKGSYAGTETEIAEDGSVNTAFVNGLVEFVVRNGQVTVQVPGPGTGFISSSGVGTFEVSGVGSSGGETCSFDGIFAVSESGAASAKGNYFCTFEDVSGTGSWNANRIGL